MAVRYDDDTLATEGASHSAARSTWLSITDTLRSLGLPAPDTHGKLTAASDAATLRVGVFVLPDGTQDGLLEDLCLATVADNPAVPCLDAYFRCLGEKGVTPPRNLLPKARAHAYLSSCPIPDKRVGEAAIAGYWPWEAPALAPLLAFVQGA